MFNYILVHTFTSYSLYQVVYMYMKCCLALYQNMQINKQSNKQTNKQTDRQTDRFTEQTNTDQEKQIQINLPKNKYMNLVNKKPYPFQEAGTQCQSNRRSNPAS